MHSAKAVKNAAKFTFDQFETVASQVKPQLTPFIDEAKSEITGIYQRSRFGTKPTELAHQELARAREKEKLNTERAQDENVSKEKVREVLSVYKKTWENTKQENNELKKDHEDLKAEIVSLAKSAGVDTKIHLTNTPKVGKIDISFLRYIVRTLKVQAEKSKSASELVVERTKIKTTGMNAWVSGKQMKIHEQGTYTLQG